MRFASKQACAEMANHRYCEVSVAFSTDTLDFFTCPWLLFLQLRWIIRLFYTYAGTDTPATLLKLHW